MKKRKILSVILAMAIASGSFTLPAGALLQLPSEDVAHAGASTAGNYLVQIYNVGEEETGKPATDYGFDKTAIHSVDLTFSVVEEYRETFDGECGGSLIFSCNGSAFTDEEMDIYNWPLNQWWGVNDPELGLDTIDTTAELQTVKVGDYTYKLSYVLENAVPAHSECVQVGLQECGGTDPWIYVTEVNCYDNTGSLLVSFDENGYPTVGSVTTPEQTTTPEQSTVSSDTSVSDGDDDAPEEISIYFDGDTLHWSAVAGADHYAVKVRGYEDSGEDICFANDSSNYTSLFSTLSDGTYTLDVYSVDSEGTETLAWSIDYTYESDMITWESGITYDEETGIITWSIAEESFNKHLNGESVQTGLTANGIVISANEPFRIDDWNNSYYANELDYKLLYAQLEAESKGVDFTGKLIIKPFLVFGGYSVDDNNMLTSCGGIATDSVTITYDGYEISKKISNPTDLEYFKGGTLKYTPVDGSIAAFIKSDNYFGYERWGSYSVDDGVIYVGSVDTTALEVCFVDEEWNITEFIPVTNINKADIYFDDYGDLWWTRVENTNYYNVRIEGQPDYICDKCYGNNSYGCKYLFSENALPGGTYTINVYSVDWEGNETLAWSIDYDYVNGNNAAVWDANLTYDEATDTLTWTNYGFTHEPVESGWGWYATYLITANGKVVDYSTCSTWDGQMTTETIKLKAELARHMVADGTDFSGDLDIRIFAYEGMSFDYENPSIGLTTIDAMGSKSITVHYDGSEILDTIAVPEGIYGVKALEAEAGWNAVEGASAYLIRVTTNGTTKYSVQQTNKYTEYLEQVPFAMSISVAAVDKDGNVGNFSDEVAYTELYEFNYDGSPLNLTVREYSDNEVGLICDAHCFYEIPGVTYGKTTFAELKQLYSGFKINNFAVNNCSPDTLTPEDFYFCLMFICGKEGVEDDVWAVTPDSKLCFGGYGFDDSYVIKSTGFMIGLTDAAFVREGLDLDSVVTVNSWTPGLVYNENDGTLTFNRCHEASGYNIYADDDLVTYAAWSDPTTTTHKIDFLMHTVFENRRREKSGLDLIEGEVTIRIECVDSEGYIIDNGASSETITITVPEYEKNSVITPTTLMYNNRTSLLSWSSVVGAKYYDVEVYNSDSQVVSWGQGMITGIYLKDNYTPLTVGETYTAKLWLIDTQFRYSEKYLELEFVYREPSDGYMEWDANLTYDEETDTLTWNRLVMCEAVTVPNQWLTLEENYVLCVNGKQVYTTALGMWDNSIPEQKVNLKSMLAIKHLEGVDFNGDLNVEIYAYDEPSFWWNSDSGAIACDSIKVSGYDGCQTTDTLSVPENVFIKPEISGSDMYSHTISFDKAEGAAGYIIATEYGNDIQQTVSYSHTAETTYISFLFPGFDVTYIRYAVCAVDKNGDVSELTPYYYANTGFKDIDHTIPAGYTKKYELSGTHTYIGTEDNPDDITNGGVVDFGSVDNGGSFKLNENDIIIAGISLKNRPTNWQTVAFNGYATDFTGWNAVTANYDGKLALRATVADIMAANDITDFSNFGGFQLQTWGVTDGDVIDYTVAVYSPVAIESHDEEVEDSEFYERNDLVWAADSNAEGYKVVIEGTDLSFAVSKCALKDLRAIFAENDADSDAYKLKVYAVYTDGTEKLIGTEIYGYSNGEENDENGYFVYKNTEEAATYTAKYDENSGYKFVLNANVEIPFPAITNNICTIGELKKLYNGVTVEGIEITGTDREGITAEDFITEIYVFYGANPDDWSGWNQYQTTSLSFADVDIPSDYILHHIGYKISLKDEVLAESGMVEGDTITVSFKTAESGVYIDEEGILRWPAVDGAESYYVRIQGQSADINDMCTSNDSKNYASLFNTANLASGIYVIEIYAVTGETEILVGTAEYLHTRYAVTVGSNTFYYKANNDGYTITSGNIVDGNVVIPAEIDGTPVTEIGENAFSAFHNSTTDNIKTVVIPEGVKRIAYYAFNSCDNLTSVKLPDSLESIEKFAFERCHKLTTVTIPKGVNSILGGSFTHNEGMLSIECAPENKYYCSVDGVLFTKDKTTLVAYPTGKKGAYTVPATVTTIGDAAFYGATGLTSVEILGTLSSIGFEAFAECDKITSVTINEGVAYVGYWAFRGCASIKTMYVPESVTNIGDKAFGFDGWGDDMFVFDGFTLSGKSGSMIEAYANRHGIPFKEIGETENTPFDEESKQEAAVDSFEGEKIELSPSKNMKDKEELDKDFNFDDFEFVVEEIDDDRKDKYKEHFKDDKVKGKAHFFEFDLKDKDGKSHGDKFDGLVEMDIPMCDDLIYGYDNYHLYRMANGEKIEIPGKHIVKNDKHYYRVHLEHFSDYVFVNETVEEVQTAPFNVKTAVGVGTKVTLSWDKPEGATSYVVYRSMTKGGELTKLCTTNAECYVDTGVVQGKNYYYYVVAVNAEKSLTSDYSEFAFATIPEDNISSFVERLYATMLGRESDAGGKSKWIQKFKGGATAADVAVNFVLSEEIKQQRLSNETFVKRMYQTMLDRIPKDSEIANWASYLDAGCTYAFVFRGFLTAPEFSKLCASYGIETGTYAATENRDVNGKLTKFISRLYTKALNRAYDVGGLNHHTGNYISGKYTLDKIASGFILSPEFEKRKLSDEKFVECMYNTFFDRASDANGKASWLKKMANGMTREQVFNGFVTSPEYKLLVKSFGL